MPPLVIANYVYLKQNERKAFFNCAHIAHLQETVKTEKPSIREN